MDEPTTLASNPSGKPTFTNLLLATNLAYRALKSLAERAGVPLYVTNEMFIGHPVAPQDAEKVLNVLSSLAGEEYSLGNTNIPTVPTEPLQGGVAHEQ